MNKFRRLIVQALPFTFPFAIPILALAKPPSGDTSKLVTTELEWSGRIKHKVVMELEELRRSSLVIDLVNLPLLDRDGKVKRILEGYRAIKLTQLLDQVGIDAPDHNTLKRTYVVANASDGYAVVFSWCELFHTAIGEGVMILVEKEGHLLGDDEGRIALISVHDLDTGPRHVRWLRSIDVEQV